MLKRIVLVVLIAAALISCKSKSAFNYSQDIVAKEKSLMDPITETETAVEKFITEQKFDSVAAAGERMENLVDQKLQEIKNTKAPDVKEGANFKAAAINYFSFLKSLYTGYKNYGRAGSDEAREKAVSDLQLIVDKKTEAINDMQRAQKKYAEANGFRIEN